MLHVYLVGIFVLTSIRLLLFITQWGNSAIIPFKLYYIGYAFLMGWRFDTVVSGYILLLPLVFLSIWRISETKNTWVAKASYYLVNSSYFVVFFICLVDVPYFNVFSNRLNVTVLNWSGHASFALRMVAKEPMNWAYFMLFLALCYGFYFQSRKVFYRVVLPEKIVFTSKRRTVALVSIFFLGLSLLAIRGRLVEKSPIRVGTAYFSQYALANQLGLNPVFTFGRSYLESNRPENVTLHLMPDDQALKRVSKELGVSAATMKRWVKADSSIRKLNVVLVIMESMNAYKMARFANPDRLTPFLDSIAQKGISFDQIRSAGIHTYNGVFATLFSQPALLRQHPMNKTILQRHTGFAKVLGQNGYRSVYFTTHDDQFDNVGGFLTNSYFDRIVSLKDYPSEQVKSTLGVPDHLMFDFAMPILDEMSKEKSPFFATFMTASDHMPYFIPEDIPFQAGNDDINKQIVRYADWSLRHFIESCQQKPWFGNTLFVFVADHGVQFGPYDYDPPLCLNHIPFIMFSPSNIPPQEVGKLGCQIDVFPTVMGVLGLGYENGTLGVDLLKSKRNYSYYCADDKICCMSDSLLYVYRMDGKEGLYFYKKGWLDDVYYRFPDFAKDMHEYAFSMLQTSQWMIKNGHTE